MVNTFFSDVKVLPVRSWARLRKALSVGAKAVSRFVPSVSSRTGLFGLAAATAYTAASTMSKSFQFSSNFWPSAPSTLARLVVPRSRADAAWAGVEPATSADPAMRATAVAEPKVERNFMVCLLLVGVRWVIAAHPAATSAPRRRVPRVARALTVPRGTSRAEAISRWVSSRK